MNLYNIKWTLPQALSKIENKIFNLITLKTPHLDVTSNSENVVVAVVAADVDLLLNVAQSSLRHVSPFFEGSRKRGRPRNRVTKMIGYSGTFS